MRTCYEINEEDDEIISKHDNKNLLMTTIGMSLGVSINIFLTKS